MIVKIPNLDGVSNLERILERRQGYIHYADNAVFIEPKEGFIITIKDEIELLLQAVDRLGNGPVTYISNQFEYASLFPYDYKNLEMIPNLIGIAIVRYNVLSNKDEDFDKSRFRRPIKIFDSLMEARKWSHSLHTANKPKR